MEDTSIQVNSAVHDELVAVAAQDYDGASLSEAIQRLLMEHKITKIVARYEELRSDPEEWSSYQAELRLWETTIGDGLGDAREEYPEYNP